MLRNANQSGYATLLALWVLVVFGGIATLTISLIQDETDLVTAHTGRLAVEARVDGAIEAAIPDLVAPKSRDRVLSRGGTIPVDIGGQSLSVEAIDACGLVDLNTASEMVLRNLLTELEIAPAEIVLDGLASVRRLDGPLETTAQLRGLPGLEQAAADRLADNTTVFCRIGTVDTAFAPRAVLAALPGMTGGHLDRILSFRARGEDPETNLSGSLTGTAPGPGHTWRLRVSDGDGPGTRVERIATVQITGQRGRPFVIVDWQ